MDRREVRENIHSVQQPNRVTASDLNPWNGDEIPLVPKDYQIRQIMDVVRCRYSDSSSLRRPALVNEQINNFNRCLHNITSDKGINRYLKRLPQNKEEEYKNRFKVMSEEFARHSQEAIKDYGSIFSGYYRNRRNQAYRELLRLNSIISKMYDDFKGLKQIYSYTDEIQANMSRLPREHGEKISQTIMKAIDEIESSCSIIFDSHTEDPSDTGNKAVRDVSKQKIHQLNCALHEVYESSKGAIDIYNYIYKIQSFDTCLPLEHREAITKVFASFKGSYEEIFGSYSEPLQSSSDENKETRARVYKELNEKLKKFIPWLHEGLNYAYNLKKTRVANRE